MSEASVYMSSSRLISHGRTVLFSYLLIQLCNGDSSSVEPFAYSACTDTAYPP